MNRGSRVPIDGRQSETAAAIQRGTGRLLRATGLMPVAEFSLPSNRRADIFAVSEAGDIWIAEIKSSPADFLSDRKWPQYRGYCDLFFFAVTAQMPLDLLPQDAGLIIADAWGAQIMRQPPVHRLAPARRKSLLVRFGRTAAARLQQIHDPACEPAATGLTGAPV